MCHNLGTMLGVSLCILSCLYEHCHDYIFISVWQFMNATDSVFGAGDIVSFPLPLVDKEVNIGHWQIALNHGKGLQYHMLKYFTLGWLGQLEMRKFTSNSLL